MFVSRNALALIRFLAVEDEPGGERTPQLSQTIKGPLPALIAAHFEDPAAGDSNLDSVAFLQFKRLDDGGGQTNCQAVSPLRNLHRPPQIYISYCISSRKY